jgi:hypothetical protein
MTEMNPEDYVSPAEDVLSVVVEAVLNEAIGSDGGMLTGFLGLVTFMDEQGTRYFRLVAGSEQNSITSLGRSSMIDSLVRGQIFD